MSSFPGRFVGKFAPFPRQEDFRIPWSVVSDRGV